jgi:tRNA threonylcarbamoyl adenosine modification protein YeaZ
MNLILTFDTTGENLSICLAEDEEIIDKFIHPRKMAPAETILNSLEFFLLRNDLTFESISQFLIINGPASFIRIRIGLAVAKALAFLFSNSAKFYTIDCFQIYNYLFNQKFSDQTFQNKLIILYGYGDIFYVENSNSKNEIIFQKAMKLNEIQNFIKENVANYLLCDKKSTEFFFDLNAIDLSAEIEESFSEIATEAFFSSKKKNETLEPFYLIDPVFRKMKENLN